MIDTRADILEIGQSPWKMLAILAGATAVTLLCLAVPMGWLGGRGPDFLNSTIAWLGVAFFGLCAGISASRLLTGGGRVVTLSSAGIRDVRVAAETIPWSAVRGVGTWSYRGQRLMVLDVDPAVEAGLTLTGLARMTRGPNRALGADGLCISTTELRIDHDTLVACTLAFLESARSGEEDGRARGSGGAEGA